MTSSSERVIRGGAATVTSPLPTPDLRAGVWTRLGADHSLGDAVIERTLDGLADLTRQAAHSEGYAVGWAQGVRQAAAAAEQAEDRRAVTARVSEESRRVEHEAALRALTTAAQALQETVSTVGRQLQDQAADLAYSVTAAALGEAAAAQSAADVVRRVSQEIAEGSVAVVRLHPDVAEAAARELPGTVTVLADHGLGRADALVEFDQSIVDLRIDRALARVREVLR